jgi:DnaJ-class molecular chaperone
MVTCIRCEGKPGKVENCPLCRGTGKVKVRR